jgi:hypothetical protein
MILSYFNGKIHILRVEIDINVHREQSYYVKKRRQKFVPKPLPLSAVHSRRRSILHYAKSFFPSHVRVVIFTKVILAEYTRKEEMHRIFLVRNDMGGHLNGYLSAETIIQ